MKCVRCQVGYHVESNGECSGNHIYIIVIVYLMYAYRVMYIVETPEEEGQNNDGLDSDSIVGIVIACLVAALLILILIIMSVIAVFRDRKKRMGKAEFRYVRML